MCPLCIATGSMLLASASSAGGLTAITAKVLRTRRANRRQSETQSIALAASTAASPDLPHASSELAPE
ncbi:MAG: hypothetical protein JWL65_3670 [Gammaproteobacteria bacterium]|nr:hypothetical protein [Gammaproteobacteria bacterium]